MDISNNWLDRYQFLIFDKIDSTNLEAYRLISRGIKDNFVILAKSQTDGKGRYGKDWFSPEGNAYFSLLLKTRVPLQDLSKFTFVTSLSVAEAILDLLGSNIDLKLKWPNDIILNDKKLAGILLESLSDATKNTWLIIGVGINLKHYPDNARYPATSLLVEGCKDIESELMLDRFMYFFELNNKILHEDGFCVIQRKWLNYAWRIEKEFCYSYNNKLVTGMFKTIGENGELILEDEKGVVHKINAGEIFAKS